MDRPAHQQQQPQQQPLPPPPSLHSMQQNVPSQNRVRPCSSNVSLGFPRSATIQSLTGNGSQMRPSRTWTPSSVGLGLLSDADDIQDRSIFVLEYNRLAKKHGVRFLMVEDFIDHQQENEKGSPEKRSWLHRLFRGSSTQQIPDKMTSMPRPRHRRSVSDLGHLIHSRREPPKHLEIQTMVRLSGRSVLYLPQEYSPCSLTLPTCLRATAQYIAQNAMTRGLFRIPGSVKVVNSLFDYYCYMSNDGVDVAGTVCCATLPSHIHYSVHDVASTFKRLLSVLPGGILGSLSLFDALIAIHSQLHGEPEFPRTKQTRVRARLIALAIGTIESQFRRELICGVFGLLSLIGRVAEVSPREDADGRPLPTGDLIGYNALGIVFGPLLIGELLGKYTMKLATPASGLLLFPMSPRKPRRERQKQKSDGSPPEPPPVNKVMVANDITEMLITNWRDVVRQMRALGTHSRRESLSTRLHEDQNHSSTSESFIIKMPQEMREAKSKDRQAPAGRDHSPEPDTPTLALNRRRSRPSKTEASENQARREKRLSLQRSHDGAEVTDHNYGQVLLGCGRGKAAAQGDGVSARSPAPIPPRTHGDLKPNRDIGEEPSHCQSVILEGHPAHVLEHAPVSMEKVPPRLSSKHGLFHHRPLTSLPMLFGSRIELSRPPTGQIDACDNSQQDQSEGPSAEFGCSRGQAMGPSCAPDSFEQVILHKASDHLRMTKTSDSRLIHEDCRSESSFEGREATYSGEPAQSSGSVLGEDGKGKSEPKGLMYTSLSPPLSTNASGFRDWPLGKGEKAPPGAASDALLSKDGSSLCPASTTAQNNGDTARGHEQMQDESDCLSEDSGESESPTKSQSVRAMAAMFESQQMLRQMAQSRRQPPVGGVEVTPLHRHTKDLLERSNSFPQWAPQGLDRSAWTRPDDHDPQSLIANVSHCQTDKSVPTVVTDEGEDFWREHTCTPGCAREKCTLESQIENLGRRLNDKSAEIEILKKRLEGRGANDSPDEQLIQARKEVSFLREKADAADRKMKILEKFTAKLREIRDSMITESSRNSSANHFDEQFGGKVSNGQVGTSPQHIPRVRFAEIMKNGSGGRTSDDDSGIMGDETVVPAKVRNCLYCSGDNRVALYDGAGDEPNGLCALHGMAGSRDVQSGDEGCSELAVAQVWSAVEELLQMEDEETLRKDWSLPVV